jgi:dissimilatory sulfite reductase (desulfoviridin) alpha/beta subunit
MVLQMTDIQLFQILKQRLGDKEAEALVLFVDAKLKENNEQNLKVLATREDVFAVKEDVLKLREDMAKQETRLSQTIYIVGVAQFLAIVASVFALIKYAH